jgi:hypothetical protein
MCNLADCITPTGLTYRAPACLPNYPASFQIRSIACLSRQESIPNEEVEESMIIIKQNFKDPDNGELVTEEVVE